MHDIDTNADGSQVLIDTWWNVNDKHYHYSHMAL